jgi:hypothetical protein
MIVGGIVGAIAGGWLTKVFLESMCESPEPCAGASKGRIISGVLVGAAVGGVAGELIVNGIR